MNKEWDLTPMYKGFDDAAFQGDVDDLTKTVGELRSFTAQMDPVDRGHVIHRAVELWERTEDLAYRLFSYTALRSATNTMDEEAAAAEAKLGRLLSDTSAPQAAIQTYLGSTENLDEIIDADPFLRDYRFILKEQKEASKYTLDEKVEEVIAKLDLTGGRAWENLQGYLSSTVEADYRGEKKTLSAIRNLAYDADPAVRKDAYDAELACYEKIKDGVCFALNSIKAEVNTICDLRKGGSPLEMTLRSSRMKKSTLDAMITAVEEALPCFWEYLKAKAKALGYEGGLKWWDMFAPMGENTATYTVEEAREYLLNHFRPFADDMADMMEAAFDDAWIDFYPRSGKVGGAFCENLPQIKQSRILTNFDGAFGDIVTLAHELGHAYHGMLLENNRPLNRDYTMPVAETASTFNETVIMNAAIREAKDPKVKLGLLESQLQDTTQIMCDIMSRYWFETAVFEKSQEGFAFPDELCAMMKEAQKRGYGDGIDQETLNPYMWVCKSHYYSSGLSFYNFPYAFGGLFAAGLYAQYLKEGAAFLPKYRALLRATAVSTCEDVAAVADIDLSDVEFWRGSMEIFKERIRLFLELVNN